MTTTARPPPPTNRQFIAPSLTAPRIVKVGCTKHPSSEGSERPRDLNPIHEEPRPE